MKICRKCKSSKDEKEFYKDISRKDGLYCYCKGCCKIERRISSAHSIKYQKEYRENHKEKRTLYSKAYRKQNDDKLKDQKREYYIKNRERLLLKQKRYAKNNQEKINGYRRNKRKYSINFRIAENIRNRIKKIIRKERPNSAIKSIGCSLDELIKHLEKLFYPNQISEEQMTWDNYGSKWHIDHILPLSSFDLKNKEQYNIACNYTNLQPLWAEENLRKGKKIILQAK